MENLSTTFSQYITPLTSGRLGHALIGLLILVLGLITVAIVSGFLKRLLGKIGFLNRSNLAKPIGSLIKAILTIFVLMIVLQHFGLTDVLAPLKNLVNKFLAAIPNMIGAGIIAYAGWVLAKMLSELTGIALNKVDRHLLERTGHSQVRFSKLGSAFVLAAVLLPILVTALGVLNIPSITVPASDMLNKLWAAIPNIIGAGLILGVTYFITKFALAILQDVLTGMNVNDLPQKLSLTGYFNETRTPTQLIGSIIMFFAMLTAATAAVNTLGIDIVSQIFARVLEFGGGILVGGVILVVGYVLSNLAYTKLQHYGNSSLANIARIAILGLVLAMGLRAMGLADNIVNMAFGFTLGAVAVAIALAFGLGGRDAAAKAADRWANKITQE